MKKIVLLLTLAISLVVAGCGKVESNVDFKASANGGSLADQKEASIEAEKNDTATSGLISETETVEEVVLEPADRVVLDSFIEKEKDFYVTVTGFDKANNQLWQYMSSKFDANYADTMTYEEIGMSSDGYAFVLNDHIYCIDIKDGSLKWKHDFFSGYHISSYVDKESGRFFVAGYDGPLLCVLSSEGELLFEDTFIDKEHYWIHSMEYISESNEIAVWYDSCDSYVYYSLDDYSRRLEEREDIITEINRYVLEAEVTVGMSQQELDYFRKALDAIFAREETLDLGVDYDTYLTVMYAIKNSAYDFLLSYCDTNKKNTAICFEYAYSAEEQEEILEFIDSEYLKMINSAIRPGMNDLEKTLAIYKKVIQRLEYDYDWLEAFNTSDEKFLFPGISIYQALSTGKGVCHSYAYVCQFALLQLGIECITLSADTTNDGGHMWLAVKYTDKYYHIDPTWDDYGGSPHLMYFGMTDTENAERGLVENWLVGVNMEYGYFDCLDESFVDFRNVTFYSLKGDGKLLVCKDYDFVKEPMDLPQITE